MTSNFFRRLKKKIKRKILGKKTNDLAYILCKGKGLEIGAMDNPYQFSIDCDLEYADIHDSDTLRKIIDTIPDIPFYQKKIINPKYLLSAPKYELDEIEDNSFDFVFSSNTLEHTPNPINSLYDQIRITKENGIIYCVIPNKKYTYDKLRKSTDVNYLIEKYEKKIFSHSIDEALDVITNTTGHPLYEKYKLNKTEYAKKMISAKEGIHHYYVFDEFNTLDILKYLILKKKVIIEYFSAPIKQDIHFAIKKLFNNYDF
jgi:SAM-dependent methyltransferase